jgi:hypothetical protein
MTTHNEQSKSRFLTLPRALIVVTAVCFLALLAVARPGFSRNPQAAASTIQANAQIQPILALPHKASKPPAGKRRAAKDI